MIKKPQEKKAAAPLGEFKARLQNADLNTYFIFGAIILVLVVGMYALFSPEAQNSRLGNPACGKIVIAADGPTLRSNISPTLSEARFFLVVNPLSKKLVEAVRNPYRGQQPDPRVVYLIAGKGEEAVIVGNIDQDSYNLLMQFSIRVFGGYQGQARNAIKLYRQARISVAPETADNASQTPVPQAAQSAQGIAQAGFGQGGGCAFICPRCKGMVNGAAYNGMCPTCPNCQVQMIQQNVAQPGQGAAWGMPDMNVNGAGMMYPYCQTPMMQGGMGGGVPDMGGAGMMYSPYCQNPMTQGGMMQGGMGMQAAFGFDQQPFVCPNCNWRLKCARQGNDYPKCPNCGSPMACDMSNANKGWKWWSDGQWAANMTQLRPQMNQMTNQPNFWQGPESTGFFLCPNCNWRMYAQQGMNEFPRCPNCNQIMARGGAYYTGQNPQNNWGAAGGAAAAGTQAALSGTTAAQGTAAAPPIFRDAVMPHAYRGVCENCHIIKADISIPATALMPHQYRGVCSNCHQILGTQAGAQSMQPSAFTGQVAPQDQNGQVAVIGTGSAGRQ